jgi:glycerol dehydrogenase-like iron-containing ADH family enzyme
MTRLLYPQESRPYLHSEIVGVGLLLQNLYNGDSEANRQLTYLMNKHGMPSSVLDVGVPIDASVMAEYENRISHSSSIDPGNHEMCERLHEALSKFFELR